MLDYFAIGLTHLLLILAAWRLLSRVDLDRDDVAPGTPAHGPHHRLHVAAGEPLAKPAIRPAGGAQHV